MKSFIKILSVLLILSTSFAIAQPVNHPWKNIGSSGVQSTGGTHGLMTTAGTPIATKMSGGSFSTESGYLPGARKISGTSTTFNFGLESNWNMVSVPLRVSDFRKSTLYSAASSNAFTFENGYAQKETLSFGKGYWVKYPAPQLVSFSGSAVYRETLDVADKWNMIGALSVQINTSSITLIGTSIASSFFQFSNLHGYQVDTTIKPGKAYWVKVNGAGKLVLKTGSMLAISPSIVVEEQKVNASKTMTSPSESEHELSSLNFLDTKGRKRMLYFASTKTELDEEMYELPPVPPAGFDVRYSSNRMLTLVSDKKETESFLIRMSSASYPLTISSASTELLGKCVLEIISTKGEKKTIVLQDGTSFSVSDEIETIKLRVTSSQGVELPKEFALSQNYPNPFNPTTIIRYQLPVNSYVHLALFNILGQEVKTLVDEAEVAGYKTVSLNASSLPSGIYFYRLTTTSEAKNFTDSKRLMLLK